MTLAVDIVLRHYPDRDHATAKKSFLHCQKAKKIYIVFWLKGWLIEVK